MGNEAVAVEGLVHKELNTKLLKWAGFKKTWMAPISCYVMTKPGHDWYNEGQPHFLKSLDDCSKWLPFTFDTLWIIRNPGTEVRYCWGFARGEMSDVICWDKNLPVEDCLSPIADEPALALCLAVEKLVKENPDAT